MSRTKKETYKTILRFVNINEDKQKAMKFGENQCLFNIFLKICHENVIKYNY